jgi:hypothetical protein
MTARPFPLPSDLNGTRALTRAVIATGLAAMKRPNLPDEVAKKLWGNDPDVALVLRAAVTPHTIANTPQLAQIAKAFIKTLIPVSAGADLLGRGIGLSFDGAAQITLPGIALPTADFVAEGAPIPVVQATTSAGASLLPHTIKVITSLTGEMLRSGNAEQLVDQVLIDATGPAVDKVLFSAAAAADRPAGLLAGIAGLTPTATGPSKGEVLVDDL